jgi:hypothetical protein
MENLKEQIHSEFQPINFDDWKKAAQLTLKNETIDSALEKNLSSNISISSIYDRSQVRKYFDLQFPTKTDSIHNYSLDSITDLQCESDLEVAALLYLVKDAEKDAEIDVLIDPNFFLSIAKFRAVRYMLTEMGREDITIIAMSTTHNKSYADVENNLIRLTTEAMSAIIGGADKVDLLPYNAMRQNDEFGIRITDNILILLKEESFLANVKDPLSGSYLIENLTADFIDSVTKISDELSKFNPKELIEEYVVEKCLEYQDHQLSLLDTQKKKIIGVNIYQNKKDNISEAKISITDNINEFEARKSTIDKLNPKVYIANFEATSPLQASITMALNTYNIPFQISGTFELVEDAYNTIKLFDPDLVIVNGNSDIERILKNMLDEYKVASIAEFSDSSILRNIDIVINNIRVGV